jgi:glycosyltransferase involved in cell wall biosynthesis
LSKYLDSIRKIIWPGFTTYGAQYKPRAIEEIRNPATPPTISRIPRISIVVPSFNQGKYISTCLTSILSQKYPNLELIVADGKSTDHTCSILRTYQNDLHWWCSEPDRGQAHALNKGFSHCTGDLLSWVNADDGLLPGTLFRVAAFFNNNAHADIVYGNRILIDETDMEIGRWVLPPHNDRMLRWWDVIPQETVFWRRSIWEKTGAYIDETFQFALDWDLWLRFQDKGALFFRIPFFIGLFRIHALQKTCKDIESVGFREMQRLRQHYLGFQPSRFRTSLSTMPYLILIRLHELLWKAGFIKIA